MPHQNGRFNPYEFNGGTILAIAGENFAIAACDTRLSDGFKINTRSCDKTYKLTGHTVLASQGFHGDVLTLTKHIAARMTMYEFDNKEKMSIESTAQMLSTMLYYRRFFPYYTYNILVGLDEEGKGCVYSYDPVGSYQREIFRTAGSAGTILQPFLDNRIGYKHRENEPKVLLTVESTVQMIKDIYTSATERDIHTGDSLILNIITKDGIRKEVFPLRRD